MSQQIDIDTNNGPGKNTIASAPADIEAMEVLDRVTDPICIDVTNPVAPASTTTPSPADQRKSSCGGVSIALGGGVARGWAHIGVLRAFDEANIDISMIAGTSIGALVGGYYLSGKLDDLEEFARSITRTSMLRYIDFTLRGSGLISGDRLAKRMASDLDGINIETMTKPFVAVATDIHNGNEIWLHDGPLSNAIRCSYALPGVFRPVIGCGKLLVDGAIVNPVPVSTCRAYEPDVVIAVNLNSETFGRGTVIRASNSNPSEGKPASLGLTSVMMESFNIIQDRISRTRLAGDPPDFTIRPMLKDIGMTEFHRAAESIDIGYEEGLHRISELNRRGLLENGIKAASTEST